MKRKFKILFKWICLFAYALVAMSLVHKNNENVLCSNLIISIDNKHKFIDEEVVNKTLEKSGIKIDSTCYIKDISLREIEEILEKNKSIKKADVYTSLLGEVFISIKQRNPVMRILTKDKESFYVDDNCCFMPLGEHFTPNVVVVSGNITFDNLFVYIDSENDKLSPHKDLLDLYDFVNYINKDNLWANQIEHIFINSNNEFELVPRVGDNIIVLGSLDNYKYKLWKLEALYSKGSTIVNLDSYSFINLKYSDKVICKKR